MPKGVLKAPKEKMEAGLAKARADPTKLCNAPAPSSPTGRCRRWAGARTSHKGTGYCWLHDTRKREVEQVDLIRVSEQRLVDREILELEGEIRSLREQFILASDAQNTRDMALLADTIRKCVATKNSIEIERRYLVPSTLVSNVAKRLVQIFSKYLPLEQRMALRDEVLNSLRAELGAYAE